VDNHFYFTLRAFPDPPAFFFASKKEKTMPKKGLTAVGCMTIYDNQTHLKIEKYQT
jgi:hypothetical protein